MERLLKPKKFDCDSSYSSTIQERKHWFTAFRNLLGSLLDNNLSKLHLTNFVIPKIYNIISTYENVIIVLPFEAFAQPFCPSSTDRRDYRRIFPTTEYFKQEM